MEKTTHVPQEVSKLTRKQFAIKISEYALLLGANLDLSKLSAGHVLTETDVKAKKITREKFEKQFHELRALIDDLTKELPVAMSPDEATAGVTPSPRHQRGGKTNGGHTTLGDALKDAGIGAGGPQPDTEPEKERAVAEETDEERRRRSGIASHTAVYYYRLRELAPEVAPNLDEFRRGNERIDQKFFLRFSNEDLERFNALFKKMCNEHPLAREIPKGMASRCLKMLEPINKEKLSGEQREFLDELTKVEDVQEQLRLIRRKPFPFIQDLLNVCDRESRERKLGEFFAAHEQEKLPGAVAGPPKLPQEEGAVTDTDKAPADEEPEGNLDVCSESAAEAEAATDVTRKAETIHPGLDATMRGLPPAALANLDDVFQRHTEEQAKAPSTAPTAQAEGGEDAAATPVESAADLAAKNAALEEALRTLGDERDSLRVEVEAAQNAASATQAARRDLAIQVENLTVTVSELRQRVVPDRIIERIGLTSETIALLPNRLKVVCDEHGAQRHEIERLQNSQRSLETHVQELRSQLQQKGESMTTSSDEQSRTEIASRAAIPSRTARAGAWLRRNGQRVAVAVAMIALVSLLMWVIIKDSQRSPNQTSSSPATGQQTATPAGDVPRQSPEVAANNNAAEPQLSEYERWRQSYRTQRQRLKQKLTAP